MKPPISSLVRDQKPYPFARLDGLKKAALDRGVDVIDLSIGDPGEAPPENVVEALRGAMAKPSVYPRAQGRGDLREACAAWLKRRFGVDADPDKHILPINGAKEALFHLGFVSLDASVRPWIAYPNPGYPVYDLGVQAAGGRALPLELLQENGYLPDLEGITGEQWKSLSILWVNYPHNPTGAEASLEFFEKAAALCRKHGVLLASDEAYCDTYFNAVPPSALETGLDNVLALFTLSKRSALPGLRSGFMAGDETTIAALKKHRPGIGTATPEFIQEAAVIAWNDDAHAARLRNEFAARHRLFRQGLQQLGFEVGTSQATIFLWAKPPQGESPDACVERMLEKGVCAVPGEGLGSAGAGYVRFSIAMPQDRLDEALSRIAL